MKRKDDILHFLTKEEAICSDEELRLLLATNCTISTVIKTDKSYHDKKKELQAIIKDKHVVINVLKIYTNKLNDITWSYESIKKWVDLNLPIDTIQKSQMAIYINDEICKAYSKYTKYQTLLKNIEQQLNDLPTNDEDKLTHASGRFFQLCE
jgi:hypothetical protein